MPLSRIYRALCPALALDLGNICAGGEVSFRPAEKDGPARGIFGQPIQRRGQLSQQGRVQRIARLRPVDRQPGPAREGILDHCHTWIMTCAK